MKPRATDSQATDVSFNATASTTPMGAGVKRSAADTANLAAIVEPGTVLGSRYEILEMLGLGGMGAVYKARDRELDRVIALKVIRPDLAGIPAILQRFKQELILARQVTHRNVVRIFDLAEADGVKFVTMEYVPGRDLRGHLAEQGKLPVSDAVNIVQQACRGLQAAHMEGVVHRDLKPGNLMRDQQGRVVVMDFGLAHSLETKGLTQSGTVLGTLEYMSPEQAKGGHVDPRSDIFAVGLIFYELLTGKMPFEAETPVASLLKRSQEAVRPPIELEPTLPPALNKVVLKCLEREPARRYQSAEDVLLALDAVQGRSRERTAAAQAGVSWIRSKWITSAFAAVLLIACAVGVGLWKWKHPAAPTAQRPISVLVADFKNDTSDPIFEGTLEPAFNLALEGAPFISGYNRGQARKIAAQMNSGNAAVDEAGARLIATREGINVVISGGVRAEGNGFRISVKAVDSANGNVMVAKDATASDKGSVLKAVAGLATDIREALGDATPKSRQMAEAETFTSSSLEAAHEYAQAQELRDAGKWEEALPRYRRATYFDPNLGRAYAGLAALNANMGRRDLAQGYYKQALALLDRMTDREKFRTRGGYYLMMRESRKAIEEYTSLVELYPSDQAGHSNLALAHFYLRDMPKALQEARLSLELTPHALLPRNNLALYAIYAGDFATGQREAQAVLEKNPAYLSAYGALAMAQAGEGNIQESEATYAKLASTGARGASMAALGLADLNLYRGRAASVLPALQKAIAADLQSKDETSAAGKFLVMAEAEMLQGHAKQAVAAADKAIKFDSQESVSFAAGEIYVEAGQLASAQSIATRLSGELEQEPQIYGKLLQGEIELRRGDARKAVRFFEDAQKISDTWLGRFYLAKAYVQAGMFTEASSQLEKCLKRRGEASAILLDDVPTFRRLPAVYYYLARAQEGLNSSAAKDSYRTFLEMQPNGTSPMLADARSRLANR
ncbi:MAG: protein kinase [Acidobacteriales bacterium]|nr:protein kinase [Terriglobales bacterium]